jgi:hypothetical protein
MFTIRFRKIYGMIRTTLVLMLTGMSFGVHAQVYPVQSTPQLVPPYSVYMSDYATPGNERLRVILVQRDLTQPSYQLRLVMSVELNGKIIMRTSRAYNPPPLSLNPGIPTVISGADLAPYLDSRNIDFVGYSKEQYERTKALPEGAYQIIFTAYDYRRQDVQVSNAGSAFYYLAKSEPPMVNLPACGAKIPLRTPQQIIFSWLSRNTSSPNSAADTEYELALYEMRPAGRNPNDIVLSTQPVFKTLLSTTQYVYSPADPLLLENMTYVWRVRAIDRNGKDAFRNNGYSEVCTFIYGGADPGITVGVVDGLQAESEAERVAKIWWNAGDFEGYRVNYRKAGQNYEWFTSNLTSEKFKTDGKLKLYDLEPDTEYETRVQGKKKESFGGFTEVVKFRTPPHKVLQCGDQPPGVQVDLGKPFLNATKGAVVVANGIEVTLLDIVSLGDGWYKGLGHMAIAHLAGAAFHVQFERIYIREDRQVLSGRMDVVTEGVASLVQQQMNNATVKAKQQQQQKNREEWAGTDFYDKVIVYDMPIDTITVDNNGYLNITDAAGNVTTNAEVMQILLASSEKAVIIQDKNGDQYVVQKEGNKTKVTKVPGGGLAPNGNMAVSDVAMQLIKQAMRDLRKEYSDAVLNKLKTDLQQSRAAVERLVEETRNEMHVATADVATDSESGSLFYDMVPVSQTPPDDEFSKLSIALKKKELEYNRVVTINFIADDMNRRDDYKVIATGLEINQQPAATYIDGEKKKNVPDADIVRKVKETVVATIEGILVNTSTTNK